MSRFVEIMQQLGGANLTAMKDLHEFTKKRVVTNCNKAFFQPFNKQNAFFKAASIPLSPVTMVVFAAVMAVNGFVTLHESIKLQKKKDYAGAKDYRKGVAICAFYVGLMLACAVIAPLVNLIDFIGSALKQACTKSNTPEEQAGPSLASA